MRATTRAERWAAKWRADGRQGDDPTDEALRQAFAGAVLPPRPATYPAIREAITRYPF